MHHIDYKFKTIKAGLNITFWKIFEDSFFTKLESLGIELLFQKVLYFYCYCNFKASLFSPSGKDILTRIFFNWAKTFRICGSEYVLWDKHIHAVHSVEII